MKTFTTKIRAWKSTRKLRKALDKSAFFIHNKIMVNKSKFYIDFLNENPSISKDFVHLYTCEKDGSSYAILCNFIENNSITKAELNKIEELAKKNGALQSFCEVFKNNFKMIEVATDYVLKTNNMEPTLNELIDYIKKSGKKNEKVVLGNENNISVFKVDDNGKVTDDVVFKMNFSIEEVKYNNQINKRLFIENAESFERGKGIYKEILINMLPALCLKNKISAIVLNASAFEVDNAQRGGQEKLENFYKNLSFFKATEFSEEDKGIVKASDFDEGLPVYCKYIDHEQVYSGMDF